MHVATTQSAPAPVIALRGAMMDTHDCLNAVRQGDPAAARSLYAIYAEPIRKYLRKHSRGRNVENAVYSILVQTTRRVRTAEIQSVEELTAVVHDLCQESVLKLLKDDSGASTMTLDRRGEIVNRMFTALDFQEREILLRSCVLSQRDDEISRHVELPVLQVRKARAKAQQLFRMCCETNPEEHAIPA